MRKPDWEDNEYIQQVWLVSTSGDSPRQLTYAKRPSYHLRWSPDGQWLAFLSKRGEDEQPQIYRMAISGGEAERTSESKTGVQTFAWSPVGDSAQRIDFIATEHESEVEKNRKEKYVEYTIEDQDYQSFIYLFQAAALQRIYTTHLLIN